MISENCRLPKDLWRKDSPTHVAIRLANFFGTSRGQGHPDLFFSHRSLPDNAPFAHVLGELTTSGGFRQLGFQAMFHPNGEAVKEPHRRLPATDGTQ